MSGIYIHVPFCKSRCVYCGFFSTTQLSRRADYVDAVCRELTERKEYLSGEPIGTIYFGGGTPTQLPVCDLERILNTIYNIYNVHARAEITIEANPDDITDGFLNSAVAIGVNRISMGVQTFDDERLRFLRRRHTAAQAVDAVHRVAASGIENISIDLMFGFPGQTLDEWRLDVATALRLPVKHISAYSLMYEEGTQLNSMLERGQINAVDEEVSLAMYQHLVRTLLDEGFEHYEISNFCRPGYASRHNSSYWQSVPYLGVGAGAHSYDGNSRQYNPDSLTQYLAGAQPQKEELTLSEHYNEFVFTGLRTHRGISLDELLTKFGKRYYDYCLENACQHINSGKLVLDNGDMRMRLSDEGLFISNDIMSDLMLVD